MPSPGGALYSLLQNRIYLGEITHKDVSHLGQHEAIVSRELWDRVQALFKANLQSDHRRTRSSQSRFLMGKLFDATGAAFTPTHTIKNGHRYHYYVSQITARKGTSGATNRMRIPADRLEHLITRELTDLTSRPERLLSLLRGTSSAPLLPQLLDKLRDGALNDGFDLHELIHKVGVHADHIDLLISSSLFLRFAGVEVTSDAPFDMTWALQLPIETSQRGKELRLVLPLSRVGGHADDCGALARAVARAYSWIDKIISGQIPNARALAKETGFDEMYVSRILPLAFLAPDLTEMILDPHCSVSNFLTDFPGDLSLEWQEQRRIFDHHSDRTNDVLR